MKSLRFLFGVSFALAAMSAPAQTLEPTNSGKSSVVISSVAITQAPERSAVRVEGEGRLDVRAARMQHPDRLVLDFVGARLAVHKTVIPGVSGPVVDVRAGQYQPNVARVVIDLATARPYDVSRDGEAVVISFGTPTTAPVSFSQHSALATSLTEQYSQPRVDSSAPAPRKQADHPARANQIPPPRFALLGEPTQPSVALASFSEKNGPGRPEANPQQAAQQAIQPANANAAAKTLATAAAQTPAAAPMAPELAQEPSDQLVVTYLDGELTIRASNALLADILNAVCEKMHAALDVPSVPNERMFAILGPGRPSEVLFSLLSNARLDFAFVASAQDPSALERVMVLPRTKDPTAREQIPESHVAQSRVAQSQPGQPNVGTTHDASIAKDSGAQQMKELIAQVRAEIANSADLDPEVMRQLDAQILAAEAAETDPSQTNTQATLDVPVNNPGGRPRHRRR